MLTLFLTVLAAAGGADLDSRLDTGPWFLIVLPILPLLVGTWTLVLIRARKIRQLSRLTTYKCDLCGYAWDESSIEFH
jgi:hypothetical protein